jgi:hypothetical protein
MKITEFIPKSNENFVSNWAQGTGEKAFENRPKTVVVVRTWNQPCVNEIGIDRDFSDGFCQTFFEHYFQNKVFSGAKFAYELLDGLDPYAARSGNAAHLTLLEALF